MIYKKFDNLGNFYRNEPQKATGKIGVEMLEHRVLLVRSRTLSPTAPIPGPGVQAILDGESGALLGYARWEVEPSPWWRRMFTRGVVAVHEEEDEPLLFTIRRAWGLIPRREVCDADGQPVGTLLGRLLHDRYGRQLAALENGVFRASDQHSLAELSSTPDGLRLTFGEEIASEPFVKMLFLAAALRVAV
jgi:hypothetical protein